MFLMPSAGGQGDARGKHRGQLCNHGPNLERTYVPAPHCPAGVLKACQLLSIILSLTYGSLDKDDTVQVLPSMGTEANVITGADQGAPLQ